MKNGFEAWKLLDLEDLEMNVEEAAIFVSDVINALLNIQKLIKRGPFHLNRKQKAF